MLTVHRASSLAELSGEREQLNAINRASRLPDPFSTFEFYENYFARDEFLRHGVDSEPWFLTFRDGGRLVGYLALRRVREKVFGRGSWKLEFFVTHDNDRPHLVSRPEDELACRDAALEFLHQHRHEWSSLELRQQQDDSIFSNATRFGAPRYYVRRFPNPDNASIAVGWGTLRDWFSSLDKKMRSNLARQFRALAALGRVEHLSSSDPAATPLLLELYLLLEPRSWKADGGAALSRAEKRLDFFRALLDGGQPMKLRVDLLLLDGVPIAGLVCGAFERRLYALHIAFDAAYARVGPGSSVLLMGMREAVEGRYAEFNLLSGFSYYKTRWQAKVTPTHCLQIYRVGSLRFLRALLGGIRQSVLPGPGLAADHNPARREAAPAQGKVTSEERSRTAELLERLAGLGVVPEGPEALARALPFELGPPRNREGRSKAS